MRRGRSVCATCTRPQAPALNDRLVAKGVVRLEASDGSVRLKPSARTSQRCPERRSSGSGRRRSHPSRTDRPPARRAPVSPARMHTRRAWRRCRWIHGSRSRLNCSAFDLEQATTSRYIVTRLTRRRRRPSSAAVASPRQAIVSPAPAPTLPVCVLSDTALRCVRRSGNLRERRCGCRLLVVATSESSLGVKPAAPRSGRTSRGSARLGDARAEDAVRTAAGRRSLVRRQRYRR
jgi:hypothetical protein